ncbi:hypothetical protein R1S95_003020 [Listeria monocytogenes]|uniref:hypothetical protein n=1 Tax=Listeria TaxID=1637 RepID=UPI00083CFB53|nr:MULTISPECIES: hypothetical protein [Listeria]EHC5234893.1 hypothetical protein [Listeria monocytogenes serotype 1/2a]MDA53929.1 hypothetical protein [Listeria monocytogenes serotype 4b]EAC3997576.1 hypothetical protein [Listeria monocytogenes]EAC4191138.1 hypothetical protein [Listeria monocytogenes]EAC4194097.1 hypothetical protein [Listeria monocytogenes]
MDLNLLKSCCDSLAKAIRINQTLQSRSEEEETYFKDVIIFLVNAIELGFVLILKNKREDSIFKTTEDYKEFKKKDFDYLHSSNPVRTINYHEALERAQENLGTNKKPTDALVEQCKYVYNIRNYIAHFQFIIEDKELKFIYDQIDELLKNIEQYFILNIPGFKEELDNTNLEPYSGLDYLDDIGEDIAERNAEEARYPYY